MNITGFRALFAISIVLLTAVFAYPSGPGSLDLTYAGTGYKFDGFGGGFTFGTDVVVQPDGKIVAAANWHFSFALARYNPDGSADTSFGVDGKVVGPIPESGGSPNDLILQPDGKLVLVGSVNDHSIALVRYNTDGSPDTTFGGDGIVTTDVPGASSCAAMAAAFQPDGKIVIIGWASFLAQFQFHFVVARYNTDGSLDTSFDGDGIITTNALEGRYGTSVVIQSDGKIVTGGSSFNQSPNDKWVLTRYNPNGTVDTTFGIDGIVTTVMLPEWSTVRSIALLADGRIVAGGYTAINSSNFDFAVARYNPDGSPDTSFDGDGKVITPVLSGNDDLNEIAIQADGKIVAAGNSENDGISNHLALVRYNFDGSLDTSYGSGGKAVFDLGFNDRISGMALDAAGNAVVAGTSQELMTARITADFAPLVEVGGRVTSTSGQAIGNAQVVLRDENNNRRYALTSPFGYYSFSGVSSNEVYVVSASSKRYRFQSGPQTITLTGTIWNVDFVGDPGGSKSAVIGGEKVPAEVRETGQEKQSRK